jgi:peptidoglycan/LPS O-acetylase OafA/YrhL
VTAVQVPPGVVGELSPRDAARLPSLTGLRFVAAFVVFGFHAQVLLAGSLATPMDWVFGQGAVGVSFFFILSGFVLTWSARPGDTPRRFMQRRFAKIYPNHLVTWFAALAILIVKAAPVTVAIALPNLLLLQAWSPDQDIFFGMNTVSWSLACELFFYALFPLMHRYLLRLRAGALWPLAGAALAVVWLIPVAARALPEADRYWAIWVFPVARVPEFIAGMVLARIVRVGRWPTIGVAPVAAFAVVGYVLSRFLADDFRYVAGTVVPLALLVAAVGASDAAGHAGFFSTRTAVWLGEISYAFYLVHQLVLRMVAWAAGDGHAAVVNLGLVLVALAISVLGAWMLYRFVERPGMRVLGPRRAGRHARGATAPVAPADPVS